MTDRNKQEQIETEVTYETFSEFLQNTPPNQDAYISDLVGLYSSIQMKINAPELRLHCSHESCNGERFFRCLELPIDRKSLTQDAIDYLYISYQCDNCKNTRKVYSLLKFGQFIWDSSSLVKCLLNIVRVCIFAGSRRKYPPLD